MRFLNDTLKLFFVFMFSITTYNTYAQSTKVLKAKQDSKNDLWGYENVGEKSYWWKEAHSQGENEELLNYGYNTEWVISAQYDKVGKNFSENLVGVELNGKVGFIDVQNRYIITPQFQPVNKLYGFKLGLAAVKKDGKYGFINKKGEFVIPAIYDYAENFGDDMLATVKLGKKFGAIDLKGDTIVPCHHLTEETMKLLPFKNKEYRNAVKIVEARNNEGYYDAVKKDINRVAEQIDILIRDSTYTPAYHSLVIVTDSSKLGLKSSRIDTTWIVRPLYKNIVPIKDGLYAINDGQRNGLVDSYGRILLPCNYVSIDYQKNANIFVCCSAANKDGMQAKIGLFNKRGGMILPCVLSYISDFSNGLASAEIEGINFTIDKNGQVSDEDLNRLVTEGKNFGGGYFLRIVGLRPTCAQAHCRIGEYNLSNEWYKEGMERIKMAHKLAPSDKAIAEVLSQAKDERKERRYNRFMNVMNVAGTVVDVAASTYSVATGTPVNTTGSSSYSSTTYSSDDNSSTSSSSHSSTSSSLNKCKYCNGSGHCSPSAVNRKKACHGSGLCAICHGTGWLDMQNNSICKSCSGTKYDSKLGKTIGNGKCGTCKGTGKCQHCNGTGKS